MLIDVDKYTTLVMDKLGMVGYYSEMDPADLQESIRKHLNQIYGDRISVLSLKLDLDKQNEAPISNSQYKEEYNNIRRELIDMANQLAEYEKPEILSLSKS